MKTLSLSKFLCPILSAVIVFAFFAFSPPKIAMAEEEDIILDKKSREVDFSELYNIMEEERSKLDEKKKDLEEQEKKLKALQAEIAKEYKKLNAIKKELEKEFVQKEEKSDVEIKNIVKLYEAMNPEEAAKAIEKMTTKLAAQLISQINPRKSGKILDSMDTFKVKEITKEMYKKQQSK
jgi:flagellar motility protein MotE (MotC chaperone)